MELLVVRHGIAESREQFAATGQDDSRRPLTHEGRRKFRQAARGLRVLVPEIDLLATSPFTRAAETAALLAKVHRLREIAELHPLEPQARPAALLPWLRSQRRRERVAVVGHEPHLTNLIEYLLTGSSADFVELAKGGACLLDLGSEPKAGSARLEWLLTQKQLRKLEQLRKLAP